MVELRGSLDEKEQALASKAEELKTAVADKDKVLAEAEELRNSLSEQTAQLNSQLNSVKSSVESLEKEKAELNSKVTQLANEPSPEQSRLNQTQATRIKELQEKLESEEAARQQAATLAQNQSKRLEELQSKLKLAEQQTVDAEKKAGQLAAQASAAAKPAPVIAPVIQSQTGANEAKLKAELQAQEKRIMELESQNHEANEKISAMLKLRAKSESQPSNGSTKANKPVANKPVAKVHPSAKDDLTRIVGIGKVFAGKLNRVGVKSFGQIAGWTKNDIDSITDNLKLGDRITREDWVKQAKALAKK